MTRLRVLVVLLPLSVATLSAGQGQGGGVVTMSGAPSGAAGNGGPSIAMFNSNGPTPMAPMPEGTGAISGVIVSGATGRPIARAIVSLAINGSTMGPVQGSRQAARQLADAKGRFVFTDLPVSDGYVITARAPGHFDGAYGADAGSIAGVRVLLSDGDWFSKADVTLWPTTAVSGTVTDDHGDPIVGAYVRVLRRVFIGGSPHLAPAAPVTTDDRGSYRIAGLSPGSYLVEVPSVAASVPSSTKLRGDAMTGSGPGARLTLGLYPTPPSEPGQMMTYQAAFYPAGPTPAQAVPVDIHYGADDAGVDIRVHAVPAWRVSGRVEGVDEDSQGLTIRLVPAGSEELGQGSEAATALASSDGSFTFLSVPSGNYTLDVSGTTAEFTSEGSAPFGSGLPAPPGLTSTGMSGMTLTPEASLTTRTTSKSSAYGRAAVEVAGHDLDGIVVPLRRGATINGHVVMEGGAPLTQPLFLVAEPVNGDPSQARTRAFSRDAPLDSFVVSGLLPGDYVLRFGIGDAFTMKSLVANGRDVTDLPLEVGADRDIDLTMTLTRNVVTLTGSVHEADGSTSKNAGVLVFPVSADQWRHYGLTTPRIRTTRVNNVGAYRVTSLPAGDYYVVAVDPEHLNDQQDPAFLARMAAGAARVSCDWGETRTVNLAKVSVQ